MLTFDNNESLASIRTKINDAIVKTEDLDTSKMPTAPDDGQQYVGKGSSWELFVPPISTPDLGEELFNDKDIFTLYYPNKYGVSMPKSSGYGYSQRPAHGTISGMKCATTIGSYSSYLGAVVRAVPNHEFGYTAMCVFYVPGEIVAGGDVQWLCHTSTDNNNYAGVAVTGQNGIRCFVNVSLTGSGYTELYGGVTFTEGWHWMAMTVESATDAVRTDVTLWLDGVAKNTASVNEQNGGFIGTGGDTPYGAANGSGLGLGVAATRAMTISEMTDIFDKFKADNGIV